MGWLSVPFMVIGYWVLRYTQAPVIGCALLGCSVLTLVPASWSFSYQQRRGLLLLSLMVSILFWFTKFPAMGLYYLAYGLTPIVVRFLAKESGSDSAPKD
jgi:hypothetical protein